MVYISYESMFIAISIIWVIIRAIICFRQRHFDLKREILLFLVYICIVVVVRFTFCPFGKVEGKIQPLVLDTANIFPFRMNFVPLVHLFDYDEMRDTLINLIGNTAMFIPLGIVWPLVFKKLDSHKKVIAAGFGCSLLIEILQLPFFERVSDIDDLILNTFGFIIGYGIYLAFIKIINGIKKPPQE